MLGMLSNITPQKGHSTALEVLAALHRRGIDARLLIAGEQTVGDPYVAAVERKVVELDIGAARGRGGSPSVAGALQLSHMSSGT